VAEHRAAAVQRLEAGGDHEAARAMAESIWETLKEALVRGLEREALTGAFERAQSALDRAGKPVA
jgi:hypothetical protein